MSCIIDSCIWIEFFGKKRHLEAVRKLLIENQAYTNPAILAELITAARMKNEKELVNNLSGLELLPFNIDWNEVADIQYQCLKKGINKLGLVDIIIAQNARQHGMEVFSIDRHMELLTTLMGVPLRKS